jgi:hypothetical protein
MNAGQVAVLMAGAAKHSIGSMPFGTAVDVHLVRVAVIALAREVAVRMAVHAAWMVEDRKHRPEGGGGDRVIALRPRSGWSRAVLRKREGFKACEREAQSSESDEPVTEIGAGQAVLL